MSGTVVSLRAGSYSESVPMPQPDSAPGSSCMPTWPHRPDLAVEWPHMLARLVMLSSLQGSQRIQIFGSREWQLILILLSCYQISVPVGSPTSWMIQLRGLEVEHHYFTHFWFTKGPSLQSHGNSYVITSGYLNQIEINIELWYHR